MPINYLAPPPAFQLDQQSVENFRRAQAGQRFCGVFNVLTGVVYFHPSEPGVGDVEFMRDGEYIDVARPLGANGGPHTWVLLMVARDTLNRINYAGFSMTKGSAEIVTRSGLNTESFAGRDHVSEDDRRIMPRLWADALQDCLNGQLALAGGSWCIVM